MADYCGVIRTNYFEVTDEAVFRRIVGKYFNPTVSVYEKVQPGSAKLFAFGCYASLDRLAIEDDGDVDAIALFFSELQEVLRDGHSIMIFESGNEKLRYIIGRVIVITKQDILAVDLGDQALWLARKMLGNDHYDPVMYY